MAARALYTPGPSEAEAAAWGLTVQEASGPAVEVWPDNVQAINMFIAASTQWRVGLSGASGLDYSALESVLRMSGLPRKDWPPLFEDIRVMEDEALKTMREDK